MILSLTKVLMEEVQTVQLRQMGQRRFDLSGFFLALGLTGGLLFVLLIVLMATSDGSSSSDAGCDSRLWRQRVFTAEKIREIGGPRPVAKLHLSFDTNHHHL